MPAGTITALRPQQRDPQRVNVFIDGAFAIGVSRATLTDEALFVGKALSQEAWSRLEAAEQIDQALQAGFRLLQARPRATAELRQRLQRKAFAPAAIEAALARLTDLHLLDDAAFARMWIDSRLRVNPRGTQLLRSELLHKGLDPLLVEETLAGSAVAEEEDERAASLAREALAKHSTYAQAPDWPTFQRRLGGYLQRRGFRFETIRPILEHLWHEVQHTRLPASTDPEAAGSNPVEV